MEKPEVLFLVQQIPVRLKLLKLAKEQKAVQNALKGKTIKKVIIQSRSHPEYYHLVTYEKRLFIRLLLKIIFYEDN